MNRENKIGRDLFGNGCGELVVNLMVVDVALSAMTLPGGSDVVQNRRILAYPKANVRPPTAHISDPTVSILLPLL